MNIGKVKSTGKNIVIQEFLKFLAINFMHYFLVKKMLFSSYTKLYQKQSTTI